MGTPVFTVLKEPLKVGADHGSWGHGLQHPREAVCASSVTSVGLTLRSHGRAPFWTWPCPVLSAPFQCLTLKGRAAQQWHCSRRNIWSTQLLAVLGIQDGVFCSHFHFLILAKSIQPRDKPPIIINQTKQNHLLLKPCYFNLHYYQGGKATGLLQILLHSCKRAGGLKLYFFVLQDFHLRPGLHHPYCSGG